MDSIIPINSLKPSDKFVSVILPSLVQKMACHLDSARPLSEPMSQPQRVKVCHAKILRGHSLIAVEMCVRTGIQWIFFISLQWLRMGIMTSQTTTNLSVCSAVYSFVVEIYRWPVDSPHKGPVMWKVFSCHVVIMYQHFRYGCHIQIYVESIISI